MAFFANEMSIHRQFGDLPTFRNAVGRLMRMRAVARRLGGNLYCHRCLVTKEPIPGMRMHRAVQVLSVNQRRAFLSWLTRDGPFWNDGRHHGDDDWLECRGEVVTDTGIGEAAYRTLHGVDSAVISAVPSDWDYSPIVVTWRRGTEGLRDRNATLDNWRDAAILEARLREARPPIRSWDDLGDVAEARRGRLIFSEHCFASLGAVPFATSAATRIVTLLDTLNRLAEAFDECGGAHRKVDRSIGIISQARTLYSRIRRTLRSTLIGRSLRFHIQTSREKLFSAHGTEKYAT